MATNVNLLSTINCCCIERSESPHTLRDARCLTLDSNAYGMFFTKLLANSCIATFPRGARVGAYGPAKPVAAARHRHSIS